MSVPFSPLITQPKTPDFMKKLQSILWMAAAGFLATACKTPTQYEYVRLSDAACTFLADGNIPKAIEVAASGPWSAETGASWLTVTEEAEGIVLAAADNKAGFRTADRNHHCLRTSYRTYHRYPDGSGTPNQPLPYPQNLRHGSRPVEKRTLRCRKRQDREDRRRMGKPSDRHRHRNRRMDTVRTAAR